jgi:1-acyl-sn-glycerol-3-phosphate acyltransferase
VNALSDPTIMQRRFRRVARPVASRLWDIETVGYDRIPSDGPAILCPNHISFLDSAFLMLTMRRTISFIGKAEYLESFKTRALFPALGMIPVDRAGGERSAATLETVAAMLREGAVFGIFPEGTRSRDGHLHKGRTGAARLAIEVGCPILPVGITGTSDIQPPGASLPKVGKRCRIEIGDPIHPADVIAREGHAGAGRALTDAVMRSVGALTGQHYVDEYQQPSSAARRADVIDFTPAAMPTMAAMPSMPVGAAAMRRAV